MKKKIKTLDENINSQEAIISKIDSKEQEVRNIRNKISILNKDIEGLKTEINNSVKTDLEEAKKRTCFYRS